MEIQEKSLLRWSLDILLIIISAPRCLSPLFFHTNNSEEFHEFGTPLPRKRALTLPLPGPEPGWRILRKKQKQRTEKQSQSRLFNTLPPEIRLQIYSLVLGNKTVRIWRSKSGLQHTSASTDDLWPRLMRINECLMPRWGYWRDTERIVAERGNLSLLLTCRKVYSEAIDILYSKNTIRLLDNDTPAFQLPFILQNIFLPERLCKVRSLEIPITLTTMQRYLQYHRKELAESSEFWTDPLPQNTWDVISTMKGLRRLKVQFLCKLDIYVDGEDGLPSPLEANLLEPLMKLNWIPDLSVEVSWPASQDSKEFMGNAPFEIIRKYDEEIEVHYEKTRW